MKRYNVKSQPGRLEYVDILEEKDDEYIVRFTRMKDGYEKVTEETITRHLFNMCLQTGYLTEMKPVSSV
ncbi:MAG: hypothetical protein LBU82_04350 [Treponema sp.]|jgi:hypothetical protein|nr:hypothetical protein [Treponema sp.]